MDFADTINAIEQHMNGINWTIKGIVGFPDLTGFDKQETDMALLPLGYVKQSGCGDYGYHGTIYFPSTYPNGDGGVAYIHIEYAD